MTDEVRSDSSETKRGDQTPAFRRASRRAFAGACAAVGLGAAGVASSFARSDSGAPPSGPAEATATSPSADVRFADQSTGGAAVTVESATLPEDGFVAIRAPCRPGEPTERVVGVSERLPAGSHESVVVDLYDVPGAEFDRTRLADRRTLLAVVHRDTDTNRRYEFVESGGTQDPPFTADGAPVADAARVDVDC